MSLERVWKTKDGQYINLDNDQDFREKVIEQSELLIRFGITGAKNKVIKPFYSQTYEPNANFNGLGRRVKIDVTTTGRGIKAKEVIDVNSVVAIDHAYVTVLNPVSQGYCVACASEVNRRVPCGYCGTATLCSKCRRSRFNPHYYECGTNFQGLHFAEVYVKCAIQALFKTLHIYKIRRADQVQDLINAVNTTLSTINGIPEAVTTDENKRDCILRLYKSDYAELRDDWFVAFKTVMEYPRIGNIFAADNDQYFLGHLLAHLMAITHANCFQGEIYGVEFASLFPVASFFNHSCSPNVLNIVSGREMRCIAAQRIKPGEELCIAYANFAKYCRTEKRRKELKERWNFDCQCVRCRNDIEISREEIKDAKQRLKNNYEEFIEEEFDEVWTTAKGAHTIAYQSAVREKVEANNRKKRQE